MVLVEINLHWKVMLLCWLSSGFRADEAKTLSVGEAGVPFATLGLFV